MTNPFTTLGDFLAEDKWYPVKLESRATYRATFTGKNGKTICYFRIREDLEQFMAYVLVPVKVPEKKRTAVAEFITRANYGLRIGNLEMDFDNGEVRYKSSIDFEGVPLTKPLIKNTIYPAVQTMDRYLPGIMKLVYGESSKSPAAYLAEIEAAWLNDLK